MIYHVQAKFRSGTAKSLLDKLTDGTIKKQRPDGAELVASMNRAVVNENGNVEWSETCFCPSPLHHERTTVLDHHFDEITTDPIDSLTTYRGRPFMEFLAESAQMEPTTQDPE
ncbi:MAG: hypothetical protein ACR2OY_11890 [Boseongicola sp.]